MAQGYLKGLIKSRKRQKRDLKIIITARNSETGTGKTTLAARLIKNLDPNWSAQRAAFSVNKYVDMYFNVPEGSGILLDEGQQAADNRRSNSNKNLALSHAWTMLRFKQVYTVVTLPSTTMLDKRLKEIADIRINIVRRGVADVRKIIIDDSDGSVREVSMERLRWTSMDGDADYEELCKMKDEYSKNYFKSTGPLVDKEKKKLEKKIEELKEQIKERDESIKQKNKLLKTAPDDAVMKREAELIHKIKKLTCKKCGKQITQLQLAEVFDLANGTIANRLKLAREMESASHVTDALQI